MEENRIENGNRNDCTFDVRTFGAKGDGATKDTVAIQQAIDTFHLAGGWNSSSKKRAVRIRRTVSEVQCFAGNRDLGCVQS